jgi:hypothetical protein
MAARLSLFAFIRVQEVSRVKLNLIHAAEITDLWFNLTND